jgi:hypothetical protein
MVENDDISIFTLERQPTQTAFLTHSAHGRPARIAFKSNEKPDRTGPAPDLNFGASYCLNHSFPSCAGRGAGCAGRVTGIPTMP